MPDRIQTRSPFLDAAAVDAWDAWFRLRENGELRDLSVESTWQRVADAIAAAEPAARTQWSRRFFDALSAWRVLIDERVLADAGTRHAEWPSDPAAVLDLPSFVLGAYGAGAQFDEPALSEAAGLAVRCLDDIGLLRGDGVCAPRLGVVGLADALALLGIDYASDAARRHAALVARTIAEGSLAASIWLARERGARAELTGELRAAWTARAVPQQLIDDAAQFGLRHARLTAIESQRRLALFANNVSDAVDPLDCAYGPRSITSWRGINAVRPGRGHGYAAAVARLAAGGEAILRTVAPTREVPAAAQRALRMAMQPFIDAPIDYPLCGST